LHPKLNFNINVLLTRPDCIYTSNYKLIELSIIDIFFLPEKLNFIPVSNFIIDRGSDISRRTNDRRGTNAYYGRLVANLWTCPHTQKALFVLRCSEKREKEENFQIVENFMCAFLYTTDTIFLFLPLCFPLRKIYKEKVL
jgi:hypothetical protein